MEGTPNATLVEVRRTERDDRILIAGTATVTARCAIPHHVVTAAVHDAAARQRLAAVLKECADHDGRG